MTKKLIQHCVLRISKDIIRTKRIFLGEQHKKDLLPKKIGYHLPSHHIQTVKISSILSPTQNWLMSDLLRHSGMGLPRQPLNAFFEPYQLLRDALADEIFYASPKRKYGDARPRYRRGQLMAALWKCSNLPSGLRTTSAPFWRCEQGPVLLLWAQSDNTALLHYAKKPS